MFLQSGALEKKETQNQKSKSEISIKNLPLLDEAKMRS
jgi:hypothetical protein